MNPVSYTHLIYKHTNRIREVLAYMPYAELVFISAKTGQRLPKLFETIDAVIENQTLRIQTGVLNEILSEAVAMQQPPSDRGKRLKIFYMTQVGVRPPTFVIFVNDKELMHFSYTRYIENKVRDAFGFRGTPLKFIIRERGEKDVYKRQDMNIQWYPGHMTKAKRQMQEDLKLIDLIIELVDARVPLSSRNPDIDQLGQNKSRLILLNKADLADERQNEEMCIRDSSDFMPQV